MSGFAMALVLGTPTSAQQSDQSADRAATRAEIAPDDSDPGDVVVTGYRKSKAPETRLQPPGAVSTSRNRQTYEYSERLARCAARSRRSDLARLRAVVDGDFNSATQVTAQDRLKRIYITCSESPSLLSFTSAPQSALELNRAATLDFAGTSGLREAAPLGQSIYDRGAFTIQAIKMFAPDLTLTRKDTNSRAVQTRFNTRETARNRLRRPSDYRYFEVAVCMVRVEPRLAVRLALSDGSARLGDVQEALIDRARLCVGGTKDVQVDPTQFRLYIADAVYRWAVAARGVDSLIPPSG
jgi:hypothetical protein